LQFARSPFPSASLHALANRRSEKVRLRLRSYAGLIESDRPFVLKTPSLGASGERGGKQKAVLGTAAVMFVVAACLCFMP
jgi:hypothetical protein